MYLHLRKKEISTEELSNDAYAMFLCVCFFSDFLYNAYVVGTHLNCIDKTHNICPYREVDKKYTGCNMKTTELLDCVLIRVCAVIKSNIVYRSGYSSYYLEQYEFFGPGNCFYLSCGKEHGLDKQDIEFLRIPASLIWRCERHFHLVRHR